MPEESDDILTREEYDARAAKTQARLENMSEQDRQELINRVEEASRNADWYRWCRGLDGE